MSLADWVQRPRALDLVGVQSVLADLLDAFTPAEYELRLDTSTHARVTAHLAEARIDGDLIPPGVPLDAVRPEVGRVERVVRVLRDSAPVVEHQLLEIPAPFRDRGSGTEVLWRSVELYRAAGIEAVTLVAANYGRYVWAMCGFEFDPASLWGRDAVVHAAERFAKRLNIRDLDDPVDLSQIQLPSEIALMEGWVPLDELVEAHERGLKFWISSADQESERVDAGKAILMGGDVPPWTGRLDIREGSYGLELLRDYTEGRPWR